LQYPIIKICNVSKKFRSPSKKGISRVHKKNYSSDLLALDNVSFDVYPGETISLIRLNGSGKTTLLRIISGIYKPDTGTVEVKGKMAPLLQIGAGFKDELNAEENIIMYGILLGFSKKEIQEKVDNTIQFAELERFRKEKLKNFSSGMKSRLGFSTALQINPDILLVDEILAVGDAAFRKKSYKAFLEFKKLHKTIIFTGHNITTIKEISDRVVLLHNGKILKIGKPNEVAEFYEEIIKTKNNG